MPSRRILLGTLSAVTASSLADCSTLSGGTSEENYAQLTALSIKNADEVPHSVTIQIEVADSVVTEETVHLHENNPDTMDTVSIPWSCEKTNGPYVVRVQHESSNGWAARALAEYRPSSAMVDMRVRIGEGGTIEFYENLDGPTECSSIGTNTTDYSGDDTESVQ